MTDEIAFASGTRLLELYRAKMLSPVEVMTETLRRLERYEGSVNAFVLYDPDSAMAEARRSEARWQKGEPRGLLDGVPVALKDTLLTRGWPRLVGSKTIDPNQAWTEDSPAVQRLRAAGINSDQVKGYSTIVASHFEIARAIANRQADVGVGIRSAAQLFELEFAMRSSCCVLKSVC